MKKRRRIKRNRKTTELISINRFPLPTRPGHLHKKEKGVIPRKQKYRKEVEYE